MIKLKSERRIPALPVLVAVLALLAAGLWRSTLWLTLLGLCGFMGACAPRSPPNAMHCAMHTPCARHARSARR